MAGDAFKRVTSGDKLTIAARAWNACLDAAEANRDGVSGGGRNVQFRQADIVLVKNSSGSDVSRFNILGISGVIFTPTDSLKEFQNQVAFTGVTPTETNHKGQFLVCLDAIKNGKIGRAWIAGVAQVQVSIASAADQFCDVKNSDRTQLKSATEGSSRILWKPSGTGTKWCVVRIGSGSGGGGVKIGSYSTASGQQWAKGTTRTVNLYKIIDGAPVPVYSDGIPSTAQVLNLFVTIPPNYDRVRYCAFAAVDGTNVLMTAEC